jgi:chaperonin GroES
MAAAAEAMTASPLTIWDLEKAQNIEPLLSPERSQEIGREVVQGYETDKHSRKEWEERMDGAIKLALQMVDVKNYPWQNASNVKFPLITIAALQFSARAYPALVKAPDIVKYRVNGEDKDGQKAARASRISRHMSYQLVEQDENWEEDFDKALLALPILGTVFKKSFYDPVKGYNCSKLVLPQNLVVHYYARTIEDAERKTECFELYDREIKQRVLKGVYSEKDLQVAPQTAPRKITDQRQGLSPPTGDPKNTPRELLEQHRYLDLDDDGYPEPYVVTVDKASKKVLRIVARFARVETEQSVAIDRLTDQQKAIQLQIEQITGSIPPPTGRETEQELAALVLVQAQIRELQTQQQTLQGQIDTLKRSNMLEPRVLGVEVEEHYTKYGFIPSPDGGFYDLGMGALLGPLNDSVNTLINQLIDSGTLQNLQSGFIGKGAQIKGGKLSFTPGEWKRVNVAGQTLRDSIVPLPAGQPSAVLFQLLSLLVTYAERVASVNDAMSGSNPGQNTPAFSYHTMLEQGLQVFNGIFKRLYRAFRRELKKLYVLNRVYLNPIEYFETMDGPAQVLQNDYQGDERDVYPASDPNAFSSMENLMKAHFLGERSALVPGYNRVVVERRILEAMNIPDVQEVFPLDEKGNPLIQPAPNPEIEIQIAEEQRRAVESKARTEISAAEAASRLDVDRSQVLLNMTKAGQMQADVAIREFEAITERMKVRQEGLGKILEVEDNERDRQASERQAKAKQGSSN